MGEEEEEEEEEDAAHDGAVLLGMPEEAPSSVMGVTQGKASVMSILEERETPARPQTVSPGTAAGIPKYMKRCSMR